MAVVQSIEFDAQKLEDLCNKHHIRRLAVFGSRLHGDFKPDSDLDLFVEFLPGMEPGLEFFGIQDELSELFGVVVDLNTKGDLSSPSFAKISREARDIFNVG